MDLTVLLIATVTIYVGQLNGESLSSAAKNNVLKTAYQNVQVESRVVGGEVAAPHSFPYQALLVYYPYNENYCGGSLIEHQWILTAAHCIDLVEQYPMQVLLGVSNTSALDSSVVNLTSSEFHIHPAWSRQNLTGDIALIKLPEKVEYNDYIKPIKLPARSQENVNLTNDKVTVSGWGWANQSAMVPSKVLRYVSLTVINNEECVKIFHKVSNYNLCTSGVGGKNPCYGDSGGPLVLGDKQDERTQVGIVSYGSNWGCERGRPAAYTRVSSYLDWISDTTGIAISD